MFDSGNPPAWMSLTPKAKRVLFRRAFLRSTLTAALLIVLYFVVPLAELADLRGWLLLVGVLCAFGVVAAWQIGRIVQATYPVLRAVEGLAAALPLYLLGFSILYYLMAATTPGSFSTSLSRMASLYFTVTVFATVGFGDIVAVSETGRAVVTVQMVANLILLGLGGRILYAAIRRGRPPRATGQDNKR